MDDSSSSDGIDGHETFAANEERTRVKLPKKLIVCCDGTWMDSDNTDQIPSNVTRITRAIAAEDDGHHPQIVYYQAGIGTGIGVLDHILGGGTGWGLAENIREGYAFLANNYAENDRLCAKDAIFLIGFSRGAYTARSLGGFICAIGILKKPALEFFYDIFADWENAGDYSYRPQFFDKYFAMHTDVHKVSPPIEWARDKRCRDKYLEKYFQYLLELDLTQKVEIKCIGVWDTVGALGIPVNPLLQRVCPILPSFIREYSWFDTRLDDSVQNAFQALALNERRFPYSPAIWERPPGSKTNLKQVWFPGAHSNVGGAYADAGIANITLTWMMDQLAGHSRPAEQNFHPHDWIKFDDSWIDHWHDQQIRYCIKHRLEEYQGWGMGKIYDSLTFPQTLAGCRVREPGRYHRTFYDSGKPDPKTLLTDTNEHVHACVRVRMEYAGRDIEDASAGWLWTIMSWPMRCKPSIFSPQAPGRSLHGWRLQDGHPYHDQPNMNMDGDPDNADEVEWVYEGQGLCAHKIMAEDRLGPFERKLLAKDKAIAKQVQYTNNGWRVLPKTPSLEPHGAKTF